MRELLTALGLVLVSGGLAATVAVAFGVPEPIAYGFAASLCGLTPEVAKRLPDRVLIGVAAKKDTKNVNLSLRGFTIPWHLASATGALVYLGATQFVMWCAAVAVVLLELPQEYLFGAAAVVSLVVTVVASFRIGIWVGSRVQEHGVVSVLAAVWAGCALNSFFALMFGGSLAISDDFLAFVGSVSAASMMLGFIALVGFLRGRKLKIAYYLYYTAKEQPRGTQEKLVGWLHEGLRGVRSSAIATE